MFFATPNEYSRFKLIKRLLKKISLSRGLECLEIGCGNGSFISNISSYCFKMTGIDISDKAAQVAQKNNPLADISKKSLLEVKDKYDVVFCFEVLEHIENDVEAIRKIPQLIKDGGFCICSVPAHASLYHDVVDKHYGHFRRYEKREFMDLLQLNNLKVIDFWSYGLRSASILAKAFFSYREKSGVRFGGIGDDFTEVRYPWYWEKLIYPVASMMYPLIYFYESLFLKSDRGNSYLILCRKEKDS